jgi:hypothetical protein
LRVSAQLAVSGRADGSAASPTVSTALLQGQQLLGTEGLVMDLRGGLDKVLEVRSEKEVSEVDKFAVSLVLNVDDSPSVLAAADLLTIDDDRLLGTDNSERNKILLRISMCTIRFNSSDVDKP